MEAAALAPSPPPPPFFPLPPFPPLPFPFPPFAWAPDCSAVAGCADCCTTHNRNSLVEITHIKQALETHGKEDLDAMQATMQLSIVLHQDSGMAKHTCSSFTATAALAWTGCLLLVLASEWLASLHNDGRHQRVCAKTGSAQPIATVQACPSRKMDKSSDAIVQLVSQFVQTQWNWETECRLARSNRELAVPKVNQHWFSLSHCLPEREAHYDAEM